MKEVIRKKDTHNVMYINSTEKNKKRYKSMKNIANKVLSKESRRRLKKCLLYCEIF